MADPPPGSTPLTDISGLKIKGVQTAAQLNALESKNISRAVHKYLSVRPTARSAPFDYSWSLKLHREMFGQVWRWAGQIRKDSVNLGVPLHQIEPQLFALLEDLKVWTTMDLVEQAAHLHHRAVSIHPFPNGNGRWSRMLSNIWLRRHGSSLVHWPEETIGAESIARQEYLQGLKAADVGDYSPIIDLHRRYLSEV